MKRAEYQRLCDIIREHYGKGLTEDQTRGWWKRLEKCEGTAVLETVEMLCQRTMARPPALGEILETYYRDKAGRTAKPIPPKVEIPELGPIRKAIENRGNWHPETDEERDGCEYFRRLLELSHGLDVTEVGRDKVTKALVMSQRAIKAFNQFGGHPALKAATAESVFLARETFVKLYLEAA